MERYDGGDFTAELGLRLEDNSVDLNGACENETSATSISGSVMYDLNEDSNMLFSVSRSERSPAVEELYSNIDANTCAEFADEEDLVVHAATGLFEIGNPNLDKETSNNLEFGYRLQGTRFTGQRSVRVMPQSDHTTTSSWTSLVKNTRASRSQTGSLAMHHLRDSKQKSPST